MSGKFWAKSPSVSDDKDLSSIQNDNDKAQHDDSSLSQRNVSPNDPFEAWNQLKSSQVFIDPPTQRAEPADRDFTRIVCMSDTHARHRQVVPPPGDVLIHAGDFSMTGESGTIQDLVCYFEELQTSGAFDEIVCIAGNHDVTMDTQYYEKNWRRYHKRKRNSQSTRDFLTPNSSVVYLQDDSHVLQQQTGVTVYGSPWTPEFYDWAFNVARGLALDRIWSQIPKTTDILVTHGPPLGRCDACHHGGLVGCAHLLSHVQTRIQPRVHVFGHIHEGYGVSFDGTTLFVNACNVDREYQVINPCIVVDLPHDKSQPAVVVQPSCSLSTKEQVVSWFQQHGYHTLTDALETLDAGIIPTGNALLSSGLDSFYELCSILSLHRNAQAREELHRGLFQLYAESFQR